MNGFFCLDAKVQHIWKIVVWNDVRLVQKLSIRCLQRCCFSSTRTHCWNKNGSITGGWEHLKCAMLVLTLLKRYEVMILVGGNGLQWRWAPTCTNANVFFLWNCTSSFHALTDISLMPFYQQNLVYVQTWMNIHTFLIICKAPVTPS